MPKGFNYSPELVEAVLADEGSYPQLAARHGLSVKCVSRWKTGQLPDYYVSKLESRPHKPRGAGPGNQNWRGGVNRPDKLGGRDAPAATARHVRPEDRRAGR